MIATQKLQVAHYYEDQVHEFQLIHYEKDDNSVLMVEVDREEALLEWFLYDLESVVPDHLFTLAKIMEVLYCHFVEMIQKGNMEKMIR
jgi:hypothetical protein